jgi:hypothetical protein
LAYFALAELASAHIRPFQGFSVNWRCRLTLCIFFRSSWDHLLDDGVTEETVLVLDQVAHDTSSRGVSVRRERNVLSARSVIARDELHVDVAGEANGAQVVVIIVIMISQSDFAWEMQKNWVLCLLDHPVTLCRPFPPDLQKAKF